MSLLDSIPVNVFIFAATILVGIIFFLILTQTPNEKENPKEKVSR